MAGIRDGIDERRLALGLPGYVSGGQSYMVKIERARLRFVSSLCAAPSYLVAGSASGAYGHAHQAPERRCSVALKPL